MEGSMKGSTACGVSTGVATGVSLGGELKGLSKGESCAGSERPTAINIPSATLLNHPLNFFTFPTSLQTKFLFSMSIDPQYEAVNQ